MIDCLRFKRARLLAHRYALPALCALAIGLGGCTEAATAFDTRSATAAPGKQATVYSDCKADRENLMRQGRERPFTVVSDECSCWSTADPHAIECEDNKEIAARRAVEPSTPLCGTDNGSSTGTSCWVTIPLMVVLSPLLLPLAWAAWMNEH